MSRKLLISIIVVGSFVVLLLIVGGGVIGNYNQHIELKNSFAQKKDERTAFYDKMAKIIKQKAQIAVKNDSAFRDVVNTIMSAREDGPNIMMKWVQESNPTATFGEVSKLYADLSRTVESQREGFFEEEKIIQDIVKQHNNLLDRFPSNIVFNFMAVEHLKYTPIQSSATKAVMDSGIDNNTDVF